MPPPSPTFKPIHFATCPVLGRPLAVVDYEKAAAIAIAWASDWAGDRHGAVGTDSGCGARAISAANTHVVTLARHDAAFGAALDTFDMTLPDGMPLVWCMNRFCRAGLRDRVYGPTFMLRCLEATQVHPALSHFLLGGTPELLDTLQAKLRARFPALRIAGVYAPPFGDWPADEDACIFARIAESGAAFVWVGLGCPKQEFWIARNKSRLPRAVYAGVGAAFAFHAGRVRQAPAWIQDAGLEWLFRLLIEPRRLWRRYVVFNSLFLLYLARDRAFSRPSSAKTGRT